jgi:hypothetical protein
MVDLWLSWDPLSHINIIISHSHNPCHMNIRHNNLCHINPPRKNGKNIHKWNIRPCGDHDESSIKKFKFWAISP